MSNILDLYSELAADKHRFDREIFVDEVYAPGCPKLTIVDLGAFRGEFGFYLYNVAKVVYAVEPDIIPYMIMKNRVEKYALDKFKLFPIAIGGKGGRGYIIAGANGGASLSEEKRNLVGELEVDVLTLNEFFEQNQIEHVDILKIDVESSEYDIFEAPDFKKIANKIDLIVGEGHRGSLKDVLEPYGFKYSSESSCFVAKRI